MSGFAFHFSTCLRKYAKLEPWQENWRRLKIFLLEIIIDWLIFISIYIYLFTHSFDDMHSILSHITYDT